MENKNLYIVDGEEVLVIRKNIKNMYLRIKDPDSPLELSIPRRMGTGEALDFVRKKLPWVQKKRQKIRESAFRTKGADRQFASGDTVHVWGREYLLEVLEGSDPFGVTLSGDRALLYVPAGADAQKRQAVFNYYLSKEMENYLHKRVPEIESATGLRCDRWRIRAMTSRWGSCSLRTGTITINLNLAAMERIYTDYVITHELCHTRVPNHGKAFYALMDQHMPGWREIRKRMR